MDMQSKKKRERKKRKIVTHKTFDFGIFSDCRLAHSNTRTLDLGQCKRIPALNTQGHAIVPKRYESGLHLIWRKTYKPSSTLQKRKENMYLL
jgi:hypothetical protein